MSEDDLERFLEMQKYEYSDALKEIKNGEKKSCWMWYIFPQLRGLGKSSLSHFYGIKDIEEAIEYLKNETLRNNLLEITQALLDLGNVDIKKVMGHIDDSKLKSSMTLFNIAEKKSGIDCGKIFLQAILQFFNGEEDENTLKILNLNEGKNKENDKKLNEEIIKKEMNKNIKKNDIKDIEKNKVNDDLKNEINNNKKEKDIRNVEEDKKTEEDKKREIDNNGKKEEIINIEKKEDDTDRKTKGEDKIYLVKTKTPKENIILDINEKVIENNNINEKIENNKEIERENIINKREKIEKKEEKKISDSISNKIKNEEIIDNNNKEKDFGQEKSKKKVKNKNSIENNDKFINSNIGESKRNLEENNYKNNCLDKNEINKNHKKKNKSEKKINQKDIKDKIKEKDNRCFNNCCIF